MKTISLVLRIVFLFVISLSLYTYAMVQGGFVSWFLVYAFLPVMLYLVIFLLYPIRFWYVERQNDVSVFQSGDKIKVNIIIKRRLPFPIQYCTVQDKIPDSLMKGDSGKEKYKFPKVAGSMEIDREASGILFPLFKRQFEYSYTLEHLPRGVHYLSDIEIQTGDIFGIIRKSVTFSIQQSFTVYPYHHQLKIDDVKSVEGEGGTAVYHIPSINITGVSGAREYVPGDRMAWIDWKQTARKDEVMTKEFDQEKSDDIWVIHNNFMRKDSAPVLYEASIELSASLTRILSKKDYIVHFISFGSVTESFDMSEGDIQKIMIDEYLSRRQRDSGILPETSFNEMSRTNESGNVVMIMTSSSNVPVHSIINISKHAGYFSLIYLYMGRLSNKDKEVLHKLSLSNIRVYEINLKSFYEDPVEVRSI
ncbi:DUF58 domain-containing protein [Corticicoccus populi]|uniref:DUF58 domain-containing protein n=1 Tax=Corticicoccus populi TaxID=1812821 RepID=A0ABW5WSN4_9STAP